MYMRNVCFKALSLALVVFGLAATAIRSEAQLVQTHIQFNSSWKYLATGAELGTVWRGIGYAEPGWSGPGAGLLGQEDNLAPYLIHVPQGIQTPVPISTVVTTFYFRTTFTFSGSTSGVSLYATNLVDDGCAIYLNGTFAGGVRAPATYNAATLFTGGTEGALEVVTINSSLLRLGQNTIAVEVHQSGAASTDMIFGMKLVSITPQNAVITSHPTNLTVSVGDPASFSVRATGGPLTYRWQRNGVNLAATTATLSIANVQTGNAGDYRVIVTSPINSVTSSVARLTVTADTDGPIPEGKEGKPPAIIGNANFGSNSISVTFSEPLLSSTLTNGARNISNYRLVPVNKTNVSVVVTNILYSTALGSLLYVDINDPNWNPEGEYFLVLNNISDIKGNNIAPYTRIGVSVPVVTSLTQISDTWQFYNNNFFDGDGNAIYRNTTNPWYGMNYVVDLNGGLWSSGNGILWHDSNNPGQTCDGDPFNSEISFQNPPILFRRSFRLPPTSGSNGTLAFRFMVDDGMVLYLNGAELYRTNMPAGPVNELTRATTAFGTATCHTNVSIPLTSLRAGTNVLAAQVHQAVLPDPESDVVFGLEMDGIFYRTAAVPPDPNTNTLRLSYTYTRATKSLRLAWPTNFSGYNLVARDYSGTDSGWTQVKNQNNPYTNSISSFKTNAVYELRKP